MNMINLSTIFIDQRSEKFLEIAGKITIFPFEILLSTKGFQNHKFEREIFLKLGVKVPKMGICYSELSHTT